MRLSWKALTLRQELRLPGLSVSTFSFIPSPALVLSHTSGVGTIAAVAALAATLYAVN